jgi:NADH-quinone oxidoreductase subunit N
MIFGISYMFGLSGSLFIERSLSLLLQNGTLFSPAGMLGVLLILAGIGFKIAMVPFQFWCPDVYEGSPTPVAAFLSVVSKTAGFAAFFRLLLPLLQHPGEHPNGLAAYTLLLGLLAIVTMTFGNLAALRQENVKRMLGYSSIAHAGYLLMALATLNSDAISAALMYLVIYLFMNLGAFWVLIAVGDRRGGMNLSDLRGAAAEAPILFAALFICLISLTGLPPTAGFVGKFMLFKVVVGAGLDAMLQGSLTNGAIFFFSLALAGVLNSVVSLYYYMKIAKTMVFSSAEGYPALRFETVDYAYALILAVPVLLLLDFDILNSFIAGVVAPVSTVIVAMN